MIDLPLYDVTDYGAKGDGTTNDRDALVAAASAAGSSGIVYCPQPSSNYYLATPWTVPDGVRILGDGMSTSWLRGQLVIGSGSELEDLKVGPGSAGLCALYNGDGSDNVRLTRLHLRGGGADYPDSRNYPTLSLGGSNDLSRWVLECCEIERSLGTAWHGDSYDTARENTVGIRAQGNTISELFIGCHLGVTNGVAKGAQRMMVEVWTAHGTSNWWRGVHFHGCEFEASNIHQLDFACYSDSGRGSGVIVNDCYFHGGGVNDYGTYFGYGICLELPSDALITRNCFRLCREFCVNIYNPGFASNDTAYEITDNTFDLDASEYITARWAGAAGIRTANNLFHRNLVTCHQDYSPACVWLSGAAATGNNVSGNTFLLDSEQDVIEEYDGAAGNGSPWADNVVTRS